METAIMLAILLVVGAVAALVAFRPQDRDEVDQ